MPAHGDTTVTVPIDPRAMHTWSVADHAWVRGDGPFELRVGTSSRDVGARLPIS